MSDSSLICGNCSGKITIVESDDITWSFDCKGLTCPVRGINIDKVLCPTKAEAVAVFRRATRVDVTKNLIEVIHTLLPLAECKTQEQSNIITFAGETRDEAEINVPEKQVEVGNDRKQGT